MTATGWPAMTMQEARQAVERQDGTAAATPEGRTRIYLRGAGIAHLRHIRGFQQGPVCRPFDPDYEGRWLGTGSQAEYETAAGLPLCGKCAAEAGKTGAGK